MKLIFTILTFYILGLSSINCQENGDHLFDNTFVHNIEIDSDLSISQLYEIFADEIFISDKSYTMCSVKIDGLELDSIGVRVKGGLSSYDPKKPLKIDFNEFVENRKFDGLKKINLHQGNMDPSFMREKIAYELFRSAGVKTVRTSFAKLFYNGVYEGLYTIVEQVNSDFIKTYFASNQGALYKTDYWGLGLKYQVDSSYTYKEFYEEVNQIPEEELHIELPKILDTESFIKLIINEIVINSTDSPLTVDRNYYLYYEPVSQRYVYIPWDYNLSLYEFEGINHTVLQESNNFIFKRIKESDVLRQLYLKTFCELLQYNYNEENIINDISNYQSLITEAATQDPYFNDNNLSLEIEYVKSLILSRIGALQSEIDSIIGICNPIINSTTNREIVINEIVASNNSLSGISDPAGGYPDWIELYNNTNSDISLKDYYLSNDKDFLKHWKFPNNVTIGAYDYLIIFADRDIDEMGVHSDFKLNKNGGEVYLSFENNDVIDSMSYDTIETNQAYARVPNGIGEFVYQNETFGASNDINIKTPEEILVYPNPAKDFVNLEANKQLQYPIKITITDSVGKLVISKEIEKSGMGKSIRLSIAQLLTGVYNITISSIGNQRNSFKLVVLNGK